MAVSCVRGESIVIFSPWVAPEPSYTSASSVKMNPLPVDDRGRLTKYSVRKRRL